MLVLGFGIWDMQYPPRDDLAHSPAAFNASLRRFVRRLGDALGSRAARPDLVAHRDGRRDALASVVEAGAEGAARSRAFNDLAAPVPRARHRGGRHVCERAAPPELSPDVGISGTLSRPLVAVVGARCRRSSRASSWPTTRMLKDVRLHGKRQYCAGADASEDSMSTKTPTPPHDPYGAAADDDHQADYDVDGLASFIDAGDAGE